MKSPFKIGDKVRRKNLFGGHWDEVCIEKNLQPTDILTIKSIGGYYNRDCVHLEEVRYGWSWDCFKLVSR